MGKPKSKPRPQGRKEKQNARKGNTNARKGNQNARKGNKKNKGATMLYKVNDLFYECKTGNWRDGFTHRVRILNKFGEQLLASTTRYYNRTWEKYHYQAAMRQAQESFERKINRAKAGKVFMNY